MGLSSLNLPIFFLNLFTSSPQRDSHTNTSDWESSYFLFALNPLPDCFLDCHVLGNTKYIICYWSWLCHLWFYRTLLHSPDSSFPRLKREVINFAFWRSYFKPPGICVTPLFLSVSSLWPFQTGDWNCTWHPGDEQRANTFTSLITVSDVTGHKTNVNGLGIKTW